MVSLSSGLKYLVLFGAFILFSGLACAQSPARGPVCNCAVYAGPHYHLTAQTAPATRQQGLFGRGTNRATNPSLSPNEMGLPRGRRYYGGRYFGSFNDRFYGPQYGYF